MRFIFFVALIIGLATVAIPLWVATWSILSFTTPWLFFAFLAWVFLEIGRRPRQEKWAQRQREYRAHRSARPRAEPASARPEPMPPSQPAQPPELPEDVRALVEKINAKVEVLLGYGARFAAYSKELYLVRETRREYLPRTIQAYLAVPPERREQVMVSTGKSPLQELREQLELLDAKLTEIAETIEVRDLDRLLANRRFLEERFGPVVRA